MRTPSLFIDSKPLVIDPNKSVGKGGEGEVYDLGGGLVVKIFKGPDHPDYAGSDAQQQRDREGAKFRLKLMQEKLLAFPKLNDRVIAPVDLVKDSSGQVVGYTMRFLTGAQVLRQFSKAGFRSQAGIDNNAVTQLFVDLHGTVSHLHSKKVQIGDFNHLGVMVVSGTPYLIDADSLQFGKFPCRSFTPRFIDPLVCAADEVILKGNHSETTDWYAFALMLFESLLYVAPYGGVLPLKLKLKPDDRILKRVSVFHDAVQYPSKATPVGHMADEMIEFFRKLLVDDWRGVFPLKLLEKYRWVECTSCGITHCRTKCPVCTVSTPGSVVDLLEEKRGKITVRRIFQTSGTILSFNIAGGKPVFLYHEDGAFYRENKQEVMTGKLSAEMVTAVRGDSTFFAVGSTLVKARPGRKAESISVDTYRGQVPQIATNQDHIVWVDGGRILKDTDTGTKLLGNTLNGQTMIFTGSKFGFGTYRVGDIRKAFVFELDSKSLNDSIELDNLKGDPLEAECAFSSQRCWFFTTTEERGRSIRRVWVIDRSGNIVAEADAEEGDGSWLGSSYGRCAVTIPRGSGKDPIHALFVITEEGLVRVDEGNGTLTEKFKFPDTKDFVHADDRIALTPGGIALVGTKEARLMTMQ